MTTYEPNPPWVDKVLNRHFDALVATVGLELMPDPDRNSPSDTGYRGKKKTFKDTELGCGHYGCVFATATPGWVFKVTSDPTEAEFITASMTLDPQEVPEGIVHYKGVWQIPDEQYKRRPVFVIVREEAENVGGLIQLAERHNLAPGRIEESKQDALKARSVLNHLAWFKEWAAFARKKIQTGAKLTEIKHNEDWADDKVDWSEITERLRRYPSSPLVPSWIKSAQAAAYGIRAAHIVAEDMVNEDVGYLVGEALGFFLDHNLLLADVHANNIGQVSREGYSKPIWVITDPGHAVPLEEKWFNVKVPVL